jgi:hypothetical protein
MTTVREGWVVFDDEGVPLNRIPREREAAAWSAIFKWRSIEGMKECGYTCRRVRVTIETIDELEQGESDG